MSDANSREEFRSTMSSKREAHQEGLSKGTFAYREMLRTIYRQLRKSFRPNLLVRTWLVLSVTQPSSGSS
jgi:hypothetical protein